MNNNSYCNSSSDLTNGSIYTDRARQMLCSSGPGSEAGAGNDCLDFSGRRAGLSCCLLHSLPQDFTTNPTVQHRRCPLPVFSLWVEETPLMRQGSAPICLMTGKADSSALPLPVLAQACLFFLFLFSFFSPTLLLCSRNFPQLPTWTQRRQGLLGPCIPLPVLQDLSVCLLGCGMQTFAELGNLASSVGQEQPVQCQEECCFISARGAKREGKICCLPVSLLFRHEIS